MSKKLYDLCRKYKYFYKKHEDVVKWHQKYYDIDLTDIIVKTKSDLDVVENEMQEELFNVFNVVCENIDVENEILLRNPFNRRCIPYINEPHHSTATIELKDSDRFVKSLTDYMRGKQYWWDH